ncbi:unnamed protein product [Arctia plantaginis]|uniref:Peptidase M14 domain-containing protein n=1 Tax=Arctia plantaginis TaxID=874455 RepID=A0A8S0YQU5_ARCPL|nr:unnamed protein product [Arctia plantaginis]
MKSFLLFCLSLYVVAAKHEIYDGYVVYEAYPKSIDEIELLNDVANELGLDIWSHANLDKPGEFFVSESQKLPFEDTMKSIGISYKVTVENIREMLELEDQKLAAAATSSRNSNTSRLSLDEIYTVNQVNHYLADIAGRFPRVTRLVNGGSSVEGRTIQYLEISTTGIQNTRKPVIVLQSLLHAREWVTLPPALYAIHKLVVDVTESDVLNNFDWIILPIVNPDGYAWSHSNARFWRKNRRSGLMIGNFCLGVDLNRNFNINWGTASSSNVCMDTFHGRGPNSEPETQVVVNVLNRFSGRVAMYIDLHSFGSMILYGWGNGTLAPNALSLNVGGVRMAQAIDAVKWPQKPNYRVGNIVAVLQYRASGGASDFAQANGIPFSYTYELPGLLGAGSNNINSFLVDPSFIRQAAVETWAGIVAGARHVWNVL